MFMLKRTLSIVALMICVGCGQVDATTVETQNSSIASSTIPSTDTAPTAAPADGARFEIAITVDDLPLQGEPVSGTTRVSITEAYLAALQAHRVPEAFGFINAGIPAPRGESEAVFAAWRRAGYPLGNHTFSHLSLAAAGSIEQWIANVEANEPYLERHMKGRDWRYMRFPNLTTGRSAERHDSAMTYLERRGYQVAEVSVSFSDWAYVDAYSRCTLRGDAAGIAAIEKLYLEQVDARLAQMTALSQQLYGRQIRQVLLMHLSAWSARTLPAVLQRIDAAGGRYVPLARALEDPAYRGPRGERSKGLLMERVAERQRIPLPGQVINRPDRELADVCVGAGSSGSAP